MKADFTKIPTYFWFLVGIVTAGLAFSNAAEGNSVVAGILGTTGACALVYSVVEVVRTEAEELKKELDDIKKVLSAAEEK